MKLYDRFARTPEGGHDIDCMPPEVHAEYAKHNYHPRARDIKAQVAGCTAMVPFLYLCGGIGWTITAWIRGSTEKHKKEE